MYSTLFVLVLTALSFDRISAGGASAEPAPKQNFIYVANYDSCDGKDANNYTFLAEYTEDWFCDYQSYGDSTHQLVQCSPTGQKQVNSLQRLTGAIWPAGAYGQSEALYLVTGGPLQGKYVYEKDIYLLAHYLKKCSSTLGYSYTTTKSANLLISDKLDINVLISPTGGYEVFKKGCTTVCSGRGYVV